MDTYVYHYRPTGGRKSNGLSDFFIGAKAVVGQGRGLFEYCMDSAPRYSPIPAPC